MNEHRTYMLVSPKIGAVNSETLTANGVRHDGQINTLCITNIPNKQRSGRRVYPKDGVEEE